MKLDDGRNEKLRNPRALEEFVRRFVRSKRERYYAFIDEIQYCYEVPLADNPKIMFTFYDTLNGLMKIGNLDIYVTGSNSRLLSKDVATHFRDRGEEVQVGEGLYSLVSSAGGLAYTSGELSFRADAERPGPDRKVSPRSPALPFAYTGDEWAGSPSASSTLNARRSCSSATSSGR